MKVVGALLDGGADDGAAIAVVLGVERAGDEVELPEGVDVGLDGDRVQREVVRVGAVDDVCGLLGLRPVDREAVVSGRSRPGRRAESAPGWVKARPINGNSVIWCESTMLLNCMSVVLTWTLFP